MVRIRLRRTGAKKKPSYRIVVSHSTSPRDGRFIEIIGYYHPRQDPALIVVKEDRLFHWLSMGAQPSDSVKRLLQREKLLERFAQQKAGAPVAAETAETKADAEEAEAKPA
jgi:small subunit ribosomal protein S16